ncbi:MAG: ABC transporter permease subunit [bacterium]
MKNKLFNIIIFSLVILTGLFFLILISALFQQLGNTALHKQLHYKEIFFAVKLTITTATISSLFAILFALPLAYALSRYNFPFKNIINSILYLPIVTSPIALGAILLIFFNTGIGKVIEKYLFNVVFEVTGIIFAQFVVIIGLAVSLLKSVFDYINPEYEEIARTLGANKMHTFFYNLLPSAKKGIISAYILTWARAVGEFGATVTLAGATPMKTETLPVAIFLSFASADIYNAVILILISIFISVTVVICLNFIYAKNT